MHKLGLLRRRVRRVWGGEMLLLSSQYPLEDYYASKEEVNSCFEMPAWSFVLQALTSNIRRDNKCSAAFVCVDGPSLDLCLAAGWPFFPIIATFFFSHICHGKFRWCALTIKNVLFLLKILQSSG
jgi:hypothetical protein